MIVLGAKSSLSDPQNSMRRRRVPSVDAEALERFLGEDNSAAGVAAIQVVDVFCGGGGFAAGLLQARTGSGGFDVRLGVDIDQSALETFDANRLGETLRADARSLGRDRGLDSIKSRLDERPLVLVACPPCQGFSRHRRKDKRSDERNDLIEAAAETAIQLRPDYLVIENVPGMALGQSSVHYERCRARLRRAGFSVSEQTVDLSHYGLPQSRKRFFSIASLRGWLEPLGSPLPGAPAVVRSAIGSLPPLESGQVDTEDPWHRAPDHTEAVLDRIRSVPIDGGGRLSLPPEFQLDCHNRLNGGTESGFKDVYGRLRWDKPSVTITAKSSSPSSGRFLHPEQHRNISVREAAILQGFPPDFVFCGPLKSQYRQIGEAVPPLIARQIGERILHHRFGTSNAGSPATG